MNKSESIGEALKNTSQDAVVSVENALFRKASGYDATVKKGYKVKRIEYNPENGRKLKEWEDVVTVEETVHVPADTVAEIFYLKNRASELWRDKIEAPAQADDGAETGVVLLPPVDESSSPAGQQATVEAAGVDSARGDVVQFVQMATGTAPDE